MLVDFPFEAGQKAFAAKLQTEFGNADKFEIYTDSSWLTKDSYTYPSYLSRISGYKKPELLVGKDVLNKTFGDNVAYTISLPEAW